MKLIALAILCAASAQAQSLISLVPTNYSVSFRTECNTGTWFPSWQETTLHTITLTNRVLTFTHVVHCKGVPVWGTALGGPKKLEDRYWYRQIGGATYWPIGGEEITYYAQTKAGWIAGTNVVLESDMREIWWLPEFVGTVTIGDGLQRTTTTGSALILSGRNLLGQPYLLQLPCMGAGGRLDVFWRFEAGERKQITLGAVGVEFLTFDLDDAGGRAL